MSAGLTYKMATLTKSDPFWTDVAFLQITENNLCESSSKQIIH
jgi:hypothetical protein